MLVVEDDRVIAMQLKRALEKEGYSVEVAFDGISGLEEAKLNPPHLILLDLMLPKMGGLEVCERLRRSKVNCPILMLTARDDVEDKVQGLDAGADDYLPKPFELSELLARIRALLRRDKSTRSEILVVADLHIDPKGKSVTRNGQEIRLTPREFSLLEALARNAGRVLEREMIIDQIWNDDASMSNTVNFHVTALRKKIDEGREKSLIQTVHGFGYRLVTPEESA